MREPWVRISTDQLYQWITDRKDVTIIDALPAEIFRQRHLPEAKNASVYEVTFPEQVKAAVSDKTQQIVVYGSSEASSDAKTAAEKLKRLGYQKVYVLAGGAAAWHAAGYHIEGDNIESAVKPDNLLRLTDGVYSVDVGQSVIEWTGRNPNGKHFGRVHLLQGEMIVKEKSLSGSFKIDMTSIENTDLAGDELQPVLISHLMSDDFFFVKLFPSAVFTITAAKAVEPAALSAPNYEIEGILELRGVRRALRFPATLSKLSEKQMAAEAHFDFDRTHWNVIYGSSRFFEHLGMHLVFDPISIQLRMIANS